MEPSDGMHEDERGVPELLCRSDGEAVERYARIEREVQGRLQADLAPRMSERAVQVEEADNGLRGVDGRPVPQGRTVQLHRQSD